MDESVRGMFTLSLWSKCSTNLKWGFPWLMDVHKRCKVIDCTVSSQHFIYLLIRKKVMFNQYSQPPRGCASVRVFVCHFVCLLSRFRKGFIWIFVWDSWLATALESFGCVDIMLPIRNTVHAKENWSTCRVQLLASTSHGNEDYWDTLHLKRFLYFINSLLKQVCIYAIMTVYTKCFIYSNAYWYALGHNVGAMRRPLGAGNCVFLPSPSTALGTQIIAIHEQEATPSATWLLPLPSPATPQRAEPTLTVSTPPLPQPHKYT